MKKPIFFNGLHDYDLEIKDDVYTLYRSNEETWYPNVKGEVIMQMVNTGNGFKFTNQKKKNWLEYDEAVYMYILLAAEKDYKLEMFSKEKEL